MKTYYFLFSFYFAVMCSSCLRFTPPKENPQAHDAVQRTETPQVQYDSISLEELQPFVLQGYEIKAFETGDINNDSLADAIVVLKKLHEQEISDTAQQTLKRPVMLILREKDGSLKQVKQNHSLVLCYACGGIYGDPYSQISISKTGEFTFYHYSGSRYRWTFDLTFQYVPQQEDWQLVKIDRSYMDMFEEEKPCETSITAKSFGTVYFENTDTYKLIEEGSDCNN